MTNLNTDQRGLIRLVVLVLLAATFGIFRLAAAEFHILGVSLQNGNQLTISYAAEAGVAYELLQGSSVTNITTGFATNTASVTGTAQFNLSTTASFTFFRIKQTEVAAPSLTAIRQTSPVDGESGVSVTRETIVRFSAPLAENTTLSSNNFYAGFGGRRLLSRLELASDRRTATLFYLEPIPGSTRIYAVFDGFGLFDFMGRPLDADGDGQAGGLVPIGFDTYSTTPVSGTAVIGRVFRSDLAPGGLSKSNIIESPLADVQIEVVGHEEEMRTRTDAMGNFKLDPCPAGRFFVRVDGRTATNGLRDTNLSWTQRDYYPVIQKAWEAAAGRTDNLAGCHPGYTNCEGTVYLPLIKRETLQPVSMTQETKITFPAEVIAQNPELEGVSITVPPNTLYSDDGTRGGKVGIAPVSPDRLPEPLPPGLEHLLDISIQTDGPQNFDRPVPACFPNLPDPKTGRRLEPGSRQALLSYNHDKGIWEAVGSMTVSPDGKFVCTDPGEGILQPGWHAYSLFPWRPPPVPGAPVPCHPDFTDRCRRSCLFELKDRLDSDFKRFLDDMDHCITWTEHCVYEGVPVQCPIKVDVADCQRSAAETLKASKKFWDEEYTKCQNRCFDCSGNAKREPAMSQSSSSLRKLDSTVEQNLTDLIERVVNLIEPFASTFSVIPDEIQNQIKDLLTQADAIAGGDSAEYFKAQALSAEEENAAYARSIGVELEDLDPGNAPSYPVLYSAVGLRSTGMFNFRGETGPFGQYSLFLPRDSTLFNVRFYDPRTKQFGVIIPNVNPDARYRLPRFTLAPLPSDAPDFDKDGLPDLVESVLGTDPEKADTDGDGILDGAEVDQGTNPLDGQPVRTGVLGTAKTPGAAADVAAANDLLAVAEGANGVSLFNIFDGMKPVLVAHVDTPGTAQAVAMSGNFVAVADGEKGLAVIDLSDLANAKLLYQVPLLGIAQSVAVVGETAYVALAPQIAGRGSRLAKVNLTTGMVLEQLSFADALDDVAAAGDQLYVLTRTSLLIYDEGGGSLALRGQLPVAGGFPGQPERKLFVGGGLAYVSYFNGYSFVDVTNPAVPVLIGVPPGAQAGVAEIAPTGSGLLVVTTSPASTGMVALYDSSQPTNVTRFLTQFDTPGQARALAIHNGLAYVADNAAGIQVMNYLPYDNKALAPVVTLTTSASGGVVEAAKVLRVTANATDDVQVRNVEFYVDGVKVFSDGNFPFEYRFLPPVPTSSKTNLAVRARAFDTGGNATWSEELNLALTPDVTPPRILAKAPLEGRRSVTRVEVLFSEPMAAASINGTSFHLVSAGTDGQFDTADDLPVSGGVLSYQANSHVAALDFTTPLVDGLYRAVVTSDVEDVAGNHLADTTWPFRVANAVFWISPIDGFWEDAANWSDGQAPGPNDDVVIDVAAGDVTVTLFFGNHPIKSLIANERVKLGFAAVLETPGEIRLGQDFMFDAGSIKGATVTEIGDARLRFTGHPANVLDGVRLNGDLGLTNPGAQLLIRNGLTVTGSILLDNGSALRFADEQSLDNCHVVFAGNSGTLAVDGGTLTLGSGMVVQGKTGSIGQGGKLINHGLISADVVDGRLTINPTQLDNTGTIAADAANSTVVIRANPFTDTGTIREQNGGKVLIN